jgi:hypothetical protein
VAQQNTLQSIVINITCTTRKKTQRVAQLVYAVGKYKAHLVRHCLAWMHKLMNVLSEKELSGRQFHYLYVQMQLKNSSNEEN